MRNGIPVNRAPLGYRKGSDGRLGIEPDEAQHVQELFERRARGEGPAALSDYLEGAGVRTSQGAVGWSKKRIYEVLGNRTYLGEIRWNDQVKESAHEAIVDPARSTPRSTPTVTGRLRVAARPRSCSRASCAAPGADMRCRAPTRAGA